jgi:diguanylate cyclase (GGDEF)-like protein
MTRMEGTGDMGASEADVAEQMAALWASHRENSLRRLKVIEDAAAALASGSLEGDLRNEARIEAHKLRGSAGTYGFPRASELAGELEDLFAGDDPIPIERVPVVAATLLELRTELEGEPEGLEPTADAPGGPTALVVTDDDGLAGTLSSAFAGRGVEAVIARPDGVEEATRGVRLALVDLPDDGPNSGGYSIISGISSSTEAPPVLVLAESGGLLDRVEATRYGASGFLNRSRDAADLVDAALRIARPAAESPATVIAVDDDESVLAALHALLEPRGYRVETVDDPALFWERLQSVAPEIAIVDFDMPRISGIDVCQAVRSDPEWEALPVLMLTAYRDPELLRRAYAAGVDDFVSKPIVEGELVARIRNRLGRARAVEHGAGDELTGLRGRRDALGALRESCELARQAGEQVAIALLDVDRLADVNRATGLSSGDELLRGVGEVLAERFTDAVLGRWDGDSFVVGMTGMSAADASRRVGAAIEQINGAGPMTAPSGATVSAGIAFTSPAQPEVEQVLMAAEEALVEAKIQGGGLLETSSTSGESAEDRVDVVIVEDDDSVVDVLRLALESLGLTSRRLADGAEAVASLAGESPLLRSRLVLLDWDLPGLDGFSILRRLAADGRLATTRVIMLTARTSEDETLKALELGADDFVAKPFSVPVLVERLRRTLER